MKLTLAIAGLAACAHAAPQAPVPDHDSHHGHDGMPHRFENADQWAKVFDAPDRDAWQQPDAVVAALGLTPEMTVADIGAGTGYFTVRLARAVPGGQVIATDIEPDMVRYLEHRAHEEGLANVRAVLSTPSDPKLAPESVDRVLIVDVWHHVEDRGAFARTLAASLKPGGAVAIVDFTKDSTRGPPVHHRLAPEQIEADLRGAGLAAELSPTKLPDQYIVVGRRR